VLASADASGAGGAAALGPTEGIWTAERERRPDPAAGGCPRWPEHARLLSSHGELIRGRCKSTNQCAYCARLAALENAELLQLDATHGPAPEVIAIVGTRTPSIDPADFYLARKLLLRAIRREWPAETATLVEFTTGKGPRAGGLRRPHWNVAVKGVPVADVDGLREIVRGSWCRNVDALPEHQYVAPIAEVGGLLRYVAEHFLKPEQAPPPGWRGHRLLKSRGYLWTDTAAAREEARAALRHRWAVNRELRRGLAPHEAELAAHQALELAARTEWRMYVAPAAALAPGQQEGVARSPAASGLSPSSLGARRWMNASVSSSESGSTDTTPGRAPRHARGARCTKVPDASAGEAHPGTEQPRARQAASDRTHRPEEPS
jgi:hypothetical protein